MVIFSEITCAVTTACGGGDNNFDEPEQSLQKLCWAHFWVQNGTFVMLSFLDACMNACHTIESCGVLHLGMLVFSPTSLCK